MNDAVAQERAPPRVKQADGDGVSRFLRRGLEGGERLAVEPLHRQQSPRRQALIDPWHADERSVREHHAIEPSDLRLALVVEFFAHPLADLARHLAGVDRGAGAPMEREQKVEIAEDRSQPLKPCPDIAACRRAARRRGLPLGAPDLVTRRPRASNRNQRNACASPGPVRPACAGARTRRPSGAPATAASSVRRRNRPGPHRGWWSASAPPSSMGPSSSPRRKRAPWRPSRAHPRAAG